MQLRQSFQIAGTHSLFPKLKLSSEEIDKRIGHEPGWTAENIGVRTRYECRPPESMASMARDAIVGAMNDAQVTWNDIDLIIDCSTSRYRPIPCNAAHIQQLFGQDAAGIPAFDVQTTCLGFVIAMHVANGLLQGDGYRHVLIVSSEAPLTAANWKEPDSAALLGDAAAAAVLRKKDHDTPCVYHHETYAEFADFCKVEGGGHILTPYEYREEIDQEYRFHMVGPSLFRAGFRYFPEMFAKNHQATIELLNQGDADRSVHYVTHQPSIPVKQHMLTKLELPRERFYGNVEEHGNLVSAGVPTTLDHALKSGKITPGETVMLMGTSAGYSQAILSFIL